MCENAMLQAEVPKIMYGGSRFKQAVVDIRFAKSNLERVGPVMEAECRGLFIQWLQKTGHDEILKTEGLSDR